MNLGLFDKKIKLVLWNIDEYEKKNYLFLTLSHRKSMISLKDNYVFDKIKKYNIFW